MKKRLDEPARPVSEPAYTTVIDGALSIEVPEAWDEVQVGAESEIGSSWSRFGGEDPVQSSITAVPDLAAWGSTPEVSGTYAVASRVLAERYTDEELVAEGPNDLSSACEPGASSGFGRPPYSGVVRAWKNCGGNPASSFLTLSASPEGRECVVVLQVGMVEDGDVEAGQHLLDTFEVDCSAVPADQPLAEEYAYETEPEDEETNRAGEEQYLEGEVDCEDFISAAGYPSQFQAQQFFDANDPSADPYGLDEDGDGFACESLENGFEEPNTTPEDPPSPPEDPEMPQYTPGTTPVPGGESAPPTTGQYGQPEDTPPDSGGGELEQTSPTALPPPPRDPWDDSWTCEEVGGGPYAVPPGSPQDADGDGVACEQ